MAFRFSLTSLFSALLILGAAHACYYQYYQEPPADFKCRWEQVGVSATAHREDTELTISADWK